MPALISDFRAPTDRCRGGVSLLELVVVMVVLGLLAAVAVPRFVGQSASATDHSLRHTLKVVRDAIDRYQAEHKGRLPGRPDDPTALFRNLRPYLRERPVCPVGPAQNRLVKVSNERDEEIEGEDDPRRGWHYNVATGQFICNYDGPLASDPSLDYDEL